MSNKCHNIALETRARTREDLEGPAHGGPRTPVPLRACIYHRSRRAKRLSSSALWTPGERRPEKVEVKTGQGSARAAGGVKAAEVKEKKKEADQALLRSPLVFALSEVKQESRGFAGFGRVAGRARLHEGPAGRVGPHPLCAEGDGLRGRWSGTRVGGKGCASRR